MGGGMQYMLYHVLIGCGYNFLVRCMSIVVLHHDMHKRSIYRVLRHVSNDVGIHCFAPILVEYLLHQCGDIHGDVGVVGHLVCGGMGHNIFDAVTTNMQYKRKWHVHNADNIQQGGPIVVYQIPYSKPLNPKS